ncbi:MAG TPA: heparinase II/III family protein [Pyrinomonadaceae bacterium]|nr:heparinase II/III family protein [Pyrinomonadaceae bacterium]
MHEDFQGDSLGQFASYPPAQDIGYEPSITPTAEFGAPGDRALMRIVQPTRNGDLRFGFIRRVPMVSGQASKLSFSYRLNTIAGNPMIELGIAGADGNRYVKQIPAIAGKWTKAEIGLADLLDAQGKRLVPGTSIEAVYLVAQLKNANADGTYRFLIDDVDFVATRNAQFDVKTPLSHLFDPWPQQIAETSYRAGDTVRIEATSPAKLAQAECSLRGADGRVISTTKLYDDGTHGDKIGGDGVWSNTDVYRVVEKDSGVLDADLRGTTDNGKIVASNVRLIVYPNRQVSHPRLYFGAGDREKLIARMNDPKLAKLWEYIKTTAENTRKTGDVASGGDTFNLLDKNYLLPSLLGYFDVLTRARLRIAHNAFTGYLTNDATAKAAAKKALLDVSRWGRWEPPWFTAHGQHTYYSAGQLAVDVALGYDLLYNDMTEAERSQVRRSIIERSIIPTYKEYFLDNRAMANTSNWIAHTVGGSLIAASAIAGDITPEESGGKFDMYVGGLMSKLEAHIQASYLPDGSYGEGISYQEFGLETLAPATIAIRRAFGVDYWNTTHIKDSLGYALYTYAGEGSMDTGDTHPPGGHGISALVYQSKDPVIRWYYSQFDRPSLQQFIFYNDDVAPRSPSELKLRTSRIFSKKGDATFRTGWGNDSIEMLFRSGPNYNHGHADEGSFQISAFGEALATEAGWSDYYKDPYYATYFTQAAGHNTVLVDGNDESQTFPDTPEFAALDRYPRITDSLTSEFHDEAGSELSSVYDGKLSRYTRRVVFVKPNYFVVFDDIKSNGTPAQLDFLLHFADGDNLKTERDSVVYTTENASLAARSFFNNVALSSVKIGHIPYPVFATTTPAKTPPQPVYWDLMLPKKSADSQFLVALVPSKNENDARSLISKMAGVSGANYKGIKVDRGGESDLIFFRIGDSQNTISNDGWTTNASSLTVTQRGTNVVTLAASNALSVSEQNKTFFITSTPVNFAINYGSSITAIINSNADARVSFFTGSRPTSISMDGQTLPASAFTYDESKALITLNTTPGQHKITLTLK